jgi:hypothetical protein
LLALFLDSFGKFVILTTPGVVLLQRAPEQVLTPARSGDRRG